MPTMRNVALDRLRSLDPAAEWEMDLQTSPAFRIAPDGVDIDWRGFVWAWDGRDREPAPPQLRVLRDEDEL